MNGHDYSWTIYGKPDEGIESDGRSPAKVVEVGDDVVKLTLVSFSHLHLVLLRRPWLNLPVGNMERG